MRPVRRALLAVSAGVLLLSGSAPASDDIDWEKERQFWAFKAPAVPHRPAVKNKRWPRRELDYFVLSQLEANLLVPSESAAKRTLIRRATYDLTGLPPTPGEVSAFLKDKRRDAYERVVDRLLQSPRFGEHLASMWLPLARYAEDQAHQVGNDTKLFYPNAYKYRDWVVSAFNRDMPYNEFVQFQLAADRLGRTNELAALGFLGLGPKYYNRGRLDVMADEWEDRVDTVTRTFLGITVACARCHEHKFEPITRADYYGLAGIFASTKMVNKTADGEADKAEKQESMNPATLHVVEDDKPQDLNIFIRGNVERKGALAPRQFLRVLATEENAGFTNGSGRRELALAIADERNPLAARVMVNRVWAMLFGKGIVDTPSNFGHSGQPPTNQELLDHLAVGFMRQGWSIKALVREIVTSSTYLQDSRDHARNIAIDAANERTWRMNRKRVSVEQLRDAMLHVSGELDFTSGKSMDLEDPANLRRTLQARISRLELNRTLMQFDYPDANVHAEKRSTTTTAMQKLHALNSPFVIARAKALAKRLATDPREQEEARIRRAYELLFSREPERSEMKLALAFLSKPGNEGMTRWEQYAQALLVSNEMLYVD